MTIVESVWYVLAWWMLIGGVIRDGRAGRRWRP
jgi:hypothetical protein